MNPQPTTRPEARFSADTLGAAVALDHDSAQSAQNGMLILNADDWGRDLATTDRTLTCLHRGALSSVSAMVFMEDSERAAAIARDQGVDAGLHLNLTSPFTASNTPARLAEQHHRIAHYLRSTRLAQAVFHPGLANAFEYVVSAQLERFVALYGGAPERVDGHHHMHLCANVLRQELLPEGTIARRNFSFRAGEKGWVNRKYRALQDRRLARRHRLTNLFFSLPPLDHDRLQWIFAQARTSVIEVETHPVVEEEFKFLAGGTIFEWTGGIRIESAYHLPSAPVLRAAV